MNFENDNRPVIGRLSSGEEVVDRPNSHIKPNVQRYVPDVLSEVSAHGERHIDHTKEFPTVVGQTSVVEIGSSDEVYFAKRPGRKGLSKIAKGRSSEDTHCVSVAILRDEKEAKYVLLTAYAGEFAGPEPYDPTATDADKEYWRTHAFAENGVEILPNTKTEVTPSYFA